MRNIICFKIVDISSSGITVKNGETDLRISFDECAETTPKKILLKTADALQQEISQR